MKGLEGRLLKDLEREYIDIGRSIRYFDDDPENKCLTFQLQRMQRDVANAALKQFGVVLDPSESSD